MKAKWIKRTGIVGAVLVITLSGFAALWATRGVAQTEASKVLPRKQIESITHDYILSHPEVILEAIDKLRQKQQEAEQRQQRTAASKVKPVTGNDHIEGDPNAPVKIIEFSDLECPFCKRFQDTLEKIMDVYGKQGKVAWVFRHFPIDSLHSKSRKEAQASECANELGGNRAFWAYIDDVFAVTPSNNGLKLSLLPKIATKVGLDKRAFENCLKGSARGGKYAAHIEENVQDAIASGGTGTPYTVIVSRSGKAYPISGAQPYAAVKAIIDVALKDN